MNSAALIRAAKAVAPHVATWVADREPLGPLIGDRSWDELAALVVVLAEAADPAALEQMAAAINPGGRPANLSLSRPDDGIIDEVAVRRVATGERDDLPLTPPERVRAAAMIAAAGGGVSQVASRLHVSADTATALLAQTAGLTTAPPAERGRAA